MTKHSAAAASSISERKVTTDYNLMMTIKISGLFINNGGRAESENNEYAVNRFLPGAFQPLVSRIATKEESSSLRG